MLRGSLKGLSGKRVLVTCSAACAPELASRLWHEGARPILIPLVEAFDPADRFAALDAAISNLGVYGWIVLTSRNGASAFFSRLRGAKLPDSIRWAAVGPSTADELARRGISGALVPERHDAEGLLSLMLAHLRAGDRALWPRGAKASGALAEGLRAVGAAVDDVVSYRTGLPADLDIPSLLDVVDGRGADAVLFDSPSAVHHFVRVVGDTRARAFSRDAEFIPIGPVTEAALAREIAGID